MLNEITVDTFTSKAIDYSMPGEREVESGNSVENVVNRIDFLNFQKQIANAERNWSGTISRRA